MHQTTSVHHLTVRHRQPHPELELPHRHLLSLTVATWFSCWFNVVYRATHFQEFDFSDTYFLDQWFSPENPVSRAVDTLVLPELVHRLNYTINKP